MLIAGGNDRISYQYMRVIYGRFKKMLTQQELTPTQLAIRKFSKQRDPLIMILHEIQDQRGYVPREAALEISQETKIPLARIYEVLTFYNYFKLEAPGKAVISVCTGTACHLRGASDILNEFKTELGIEPGASTDDKMFHLQMVRCVGCCGLAPVVVVNNKTYGKFEPSQVKHLLSQWREKFSD